MKGICMRREQAERLACGDVQHVSMLHYCTSFTCVFCTQLSSFLIAPSRRKLIFCLETNKVPVKLVHLLLFSTCIVKIPNIFIKYEELPEIMKQLSMIKVYTADF